MDMIPAAFTLVFVLLGLPFYVDIRSHLQPVVVRS